MKDIIREVKCIDMTNEGYGIAKDDGYILFVKGTIIDEVAKVKVISKKKNYGYAIIDEIIEASPYRITPKCPVANKCGSCDLQHMNYKGQLEFKKKSVINVFESIAHMNVNVKDTLGADDIYYYRDKVQIPIKDHMFGYYRKHSNDIVECNRCLLQSLKVNEIISYLKQQLISLGLDQHFRHLVIKEGYHSKEIMIAYVTKDNIKDKLIDLNNALVKKYPEVVSILMNINSRNDNVILGDKTVLLYGKEKIKDTLCGLEFEISLKSFYQIDVAQAEKLYNCAAKMAKIKPSDTILDLYCGIGTITLCLAKYAKEVVGVEIVEEAIKDAKKNAIANGIENVSFFCQDAKEGIDKLLKGKDIVFVDPPRKGLSQEVRDALNNSDIKKIVYISCNPSTQARDVLDLAKNYELVECQPVDMFPNTAHVETVCLLSNRKPDTKVRIDVDLEDYYRIKDAKKNQN